MVEYVDVVKLALGDLDEGGDVATQIQQGVQFDGSFSLPEFGPGKHGQTKIDRGGIEQIQFVFKRESMTG